MYNFKSSLLLRRCVHRCIFHFRSVSSLSNNPLIDDADNLVLVEGKAYSRTAILNRPSVLNALNTTVGARLHKLYKSWEDNPDIGFVALKGKDRAFCAGGDIVSLYKLINEGKLEECKEFFWTLYNHIYFLGTYLKPHVAILNGITMGGGAGISVPGTFRVATDKTVFATPETLIGFHPDAGASFYLSHLPGYLGEYLALTGDKLSGAEMMSCGLSTHYSLIAVTKTVRDMQGCLSAWLVKHGLFHLYLNLVLLRLCDPKVLENEVAKTNDAWCTSTLMKLKDAAPLSLKVSLRSIREGRFQSLDQCLIREYRMSLQGISRQITVDFHEGVRAKLVDKDFAPKWDPPTLEQVSQDMIDQYFAPLTAFEPELELPTKQREAFA
ncbi:3-hydroxyisobutyryl- hydrolase 1, mitochondrial [Olea europaea subsp. europaea]|uniref:3-hydroxyisobutyryl-CoA hydrolase n=1 Tax=Olea europaea subsp. europaea TaxID=158383 RepID=A0A8S0V866_OLEEU|nr:3-hydroxyisobutyryl- hydrolase 1, mitochondrial [Olea europaea subsp. europaea]